MTQTMSDNGDNRLASAIVIGGSSITTSGQPDGSFELYLGGNPSRSTQGLQAVSDTIISRSSPFVKRSQGSRDSNPSERLVGLQTFFRDSMPAVVETRQRAKAAGMRVRHDSAEHKDGNASGSNETFQVTRGAHNMTKADKKVAYSNRVRAKKEATTTGKSKNPGCGQSKMPPPSLVDGVVDCSKMPKNIELDDSETSEAGVTPSVVTQEKPNKQNSARSEIKKLNFYPNPSAYSAGPFFDGSSYSFDHTLVRVVQADDVCESTGIGWFRTQEQTHKEQVRPLPTVEEITLDAYMHRDVNGLNDMVPSRSFVILAPLYQLYTKSFPSSKVDSQIAAALQAAAMRHTGASGLRMSWLISQTIEYYISIVHRQRSTVLGNQFMCTKLMNNCEEVGFGSMGIESVVSGYLGIVETHAFIQVPDAQCTLPPYQNRTDYTLTKFENVTALNGDGTVFVPTGAEKERKGLGVVFTPTVNQKSERHITRMFALYGRGMDPFQEYACSATNLTAGLKRIVGARADENLLRGRSLYLGKLICKSFCGDGDDFRYDIKEVHKKLMGTRRLIVQALTEGEVNAYSGLIGDIKAILSECHRSMVQRYVDSLKTSGAWVYNSIHHGYLTTFSSLISRQACAEIPHLKRKLRQKYVEGSLLNDDTNIMVKRMAVALKREFAKPGKAPRVIVQYGAGAMYANELPEYVKVCIDGGHYLSGKVSTFVYVMSKPKEDSLEKAFKMLFEAMSIPNYMCVVIYSDDSCYSGCIDGKSFGYNVDVSSNDSAQDVPAFLCSYIAMSGFSASRASGLIDQCCLPIQITNPENPTEYAVIKFDGPFEGSGTCITTILNHFGSYMIASAVHNLLNNVGLTVSECIIKGAEMVGHLVTCEPWEVDGSLMFERAQFLKRSPVMSEGKWIPALNMGTILRGLGSVWDDLLCEQLNVSAPQFASMSSVRRMDTFTSVVIAGLVHEPNNPILAALRARFNSDIKSVEVHPGTGLNSLKLFSESVDAHRDASLSAYKYGGHTGSLDRYNLAPNEVAEIVHGISQIRVGTQLSTTGVAKIFALDYGCVYH